MMKINQLLLAARHPAAVPLPFEGELPSLSGATAWLNSPPLSAADLRGKVVLIDFWTYTCINWLRTLPYIRAWAEKYQQYGVVVIGNWSGLPDQLVQTLLGHRAGALFVNINSARHAWRLSVDQHAKFHGRSWRRWAHD